MLVYHCNVNSCTYILYIGKRCKNCKAVAGAISVGAIIRILSFEVEH